MSELQEAMITISHFANDSSYFYFFRNKIKFIFFLYFFTKYITNFNNFINRFRLIIVVIEYIINVKLL